MIPLWKLKRELTRPFQQLADLPRVLSEPFKRAAYDRNRWDRIIETDGEFHQTSKYAIFLIYQPGPLPDSLIETCDYLTSNNYTILLVSNTKLAEPAIAKLAPRCWKILQRPNFGYDFGGLRDGIHFLQRANINPTNLILINDSIWFPISPDADVISRLETSPYDLCGLMLHVPFRNEQIKDETRRFKKRKLTEHIESYVTHLPEKIWLHPAFIKFWDTYKQTSSKTLTIKRGEIGFSKDMSAAGLSVGALSSRSAFQEAIKHKPTEFLEKTLKYAAYVDPNFEKQHAELGNSSEDLHRHDALLSHILEVTDRRRFNASFCWATENIFALSFIKKHNGTIFKRSRREFIAAIKANDLQAGSPAALKEIEAMVANETA